MHNCLHWYFLLYHLDLNYCLISLTFGWKNFFYISCKEGVLPMCSLNFSLSGMSLFCLYFKKIVLLDCWLTGFYSLHFEYTIPIIFWSHFSFIEKFVASLVWVPLYILSLFFFFFTDFKMSCLSWASNILTIICMCRFQSLCTYPTWSLLNSLDM